GVTNDRRLVRFRTLTAVMAVLDEFLGVVPGTTGVGQEVGHQLTGEDHRCQEGAQCEVVDPETDDHRCEDRQQGRGEQLSKRCRGADVDDGSVVRTTLPPEDRTVCELTTDPLDHRSSGPTAGPESHCPEEEGAGATDEQTDESRRV